MTEVFPLRNCLILFCYKTLKYYYRRLWWFEGGGGGYLLLQGRISPFSYRIYEISAYSLYYVSCVNLAFIEDAFDPYTGPFGFLTDRHGLQLKCKSSRSCPEKTVCFQRACALGMFPRDFLSKWKRYGHLQWLKSSR
jgi:hypothetical protein